MNILILYREESACDYHRIWMPFRYLPLESGESVTYKSDKEEVMVKDFKKADLVIFNRHPTVDIDHLAFLKKEYNFKIWVDVDDAWELYTHHYLYDEWNKKGVGNLVLRSMNLADVITVTNSRLLRKVKPINSKCIIIPNALPFGHEQFRSRKEESSSVRFMYAGGPSHYHDLKSISVFFSMASRQLGFITKSTFILAGYNSDYKEEALHNMNGIMKMTPSYETRDALPLDKYMDHYNHTDIALSPLENNNFNYYKSNLKIIEAGCMKTPIIVSKMYPFLEDQEIAGHGVYFCEKPQDWYDVAKTLLDNKNLITTAGEALHKYVKEKYDLLKINELRRRIINSFK